MKLVLAFLLSWMAFAVRAYGHGPSCASWLLTQGIATGPAAVVVVDPFSFRAGEQYPARIQQRGDTPILVISNENAPEYYTSRLRNEGAEVIVHKGNLAATRAAIDAKAKKLGLSVRGVVSGTDGGVLLMDSLAFVYSVPANGINLSPYRRDKVLMQWRLQEEGLSYIPSDYAKTPDDVARFLRTRLKNFPERKLVVKPLSSACTDRVYLLDDLKKVPGALVDIFSKPTVYGEPNERAICQAEVKGVEYIFDTVSVTVLGQGKVRTYHQAVGAWRYHRRPSASPDLAPVIDHVEWVPFEDLPKGMAEYAFKVLDALEVRIGPSHLEIMMTAEGPVLVEIGARLPGGLPEIAAQATGPEFHQTELALDAIFRPKKLVDLFARTQGAYPTRQHADIVFLSVEEAGKKLSREGVAQLNKTNFPSLSDHRVFAVADKELAPTTNVTNALLRAHFTGTPAQVKADGEALRRRHRRQEFYTAP